MSAGLSPVRDVDGVIERLLFLVEESAKAGNPTLALPIGFKVQGLEDT